MEAIEKVAEKAQLQLDRENARDIVTQTVIAIVNEFIKGRRVMCYGGTAINNLLPPEERFYDPDRDIPDYDFFSETPQLHAVELADQIAKAGYKSIEVKPGVHLGTFKVFANYTGVADISFMEKPIFERLWQDSIERDKIHYVPPNFLRMSVYLELSRPRGDVSRWKKVYTRISKLNDHHPMVCPLKMENMTMEVVTPELRKPIEDLIVREKAVLLGFNASTIQQKKGAGMWKLPLDVLVTPEKRKEVADKFKGVFGGGTVVKDNDAFGEILPPYTDVEKDGWALVRVYETNACHSYHEMSSGLRVASIPTLLQFFLAMVYGDDHVREDIPEQRFLCTAQHLVEMANDNLPRRYKLLTPIDCIGHQDSIIDMKIHKSLAYEEALKKGKTSREYLEHFFTYDPTKTTPAEKAKIRKTLRRSKL